MASRSDSVILGINKPEVVLSISNIDEASGLVVPIPTWENDKLMQKQMKRNFRVFMMSGFVVYHCIVEK